MKIHLSADSLKTQTFFNRKQNFTDAEQPDNGDDEVETLHKIGKAKCHTQLARHNVKAHRRQNEADANSDKRFKRITPAESDKRGEGKELDREDFRRAESERYVREERREQGDEHNGEKSADEGRRERARESLATLA